MSLVVCRRTYRLNVTRLSYKRDRSTPQSVSAWGWLLPSKTSNACILRYHIVCAALCIWLSCPAIELTIHSLVVMKFIFETPTIKYFADYLRAICCCTHLYAPQYAPLSSGWYLYLRVIYTNKAIDSAINLLFLTWLLEKLTTSNFNTQSCPVLTT